MPVSARPLVTPGPFVFDAPTLLDTPVIDLFTPWDDPKRPRADPFNHFDWAENIARLIAKAKGLGPRTPEADDLVQVAHMALCRVAEQFDFAKVRPGESADGKFRGLVWHHIRGDCSREAIRLRNGGAFDTTNDADAKAMCVGGIPDGCAAPVPGEDGYPRVRRRWDDATGDEVHDCRPVAHRVLTRRLSRRLCRLLAVFERWPAPGRDVCEAIEAAISATEREPAACPEALPEFTEDWFSQFDTVRPAPTDHRSETPLVAELTRERRIERDDRRSRYTARWREAIREHFEG